MVTSLPWLHEYRSNIASRGAGLRCHDPSLDQPRDAVSSAGGRDRDLGDHAHGRAGAVRTLLARRPVGGDVVRFREPELSIFCERDVGTSGVSRLNETCAIARTTFPGINLSDRRS